MSRVAGFAPGILAVLLLVGRGNAQEAASVDTLDARLEVSTSVVKVGEPVRVRLSVPVPEAGARLTGPTAPGVVGDIDLRASNPVPAGPDSAAWLVELAFFRPGDVELPPLPFALVPGGGGEPVPVRTAPYRFSIVSSLPDTASAADIRDIRGPIAPPVRWDGKRIAGAIAILLLLAAAVLLWRRRRRPEEVHAPARPAVPPEEVALRALRALEEEALPARGKFEEHYVRLSNILRAYVEGRFGIPALESTTFEIEERLRQGRVRAESPDDLLRFLDEADLVKFAKGRPDLRDAEGALAGVREWVVRNTPRPAAGEAA